MCIQYNLNQTLLSLELSTYLEPNHFEQLFIS